ncbi:DUF1801 domain-containing protein [Microbacterium sp. NPDC076911]|uniref:DUF1801 domain-containing protein n=1 Tax=Microbacterium sp. NPDC076911 TaxID=3154958 RepID=UPI0034424D9C
MHKTGGSVDEFISKVTPAVRRRDAETLVSLMREISGREPELWGTIIGFGSCHYRYATGNQGDMPILAFAPRRAASTIYFDALERHAVAMADLGPHTSSVACLYVKDLEKVDESVLRTMLERAYTDVMNGTTSYASLEVTG